MPRTLVCPLCAMDNTYIDGDEYICPDCAHQWPARAASADEGGDEAKVVRDANGTVLSDGDAVILVKDLKVRGTSVNLKKGTKVKGIRLVIGDHDVDCKIDNASYMLKSEFLKRREIGEFSRRPGA